MLNWQQVLDFANQGNPKPEREVTRSDEEWRTLLDEQQYYVMRQHGTERAFSNAMCELFEPGLYQCAGCQTLLFDSATKFDSGTGWPSFSSASQIQCHFLPYGSPLSACSSGSAL